MSQNVHAEMDSKSEEKVAYQKWEDVDKRHTFNI